ncbi:MAG TPA: hypothetical protein PK918_03940 [Methanotrichaceae archaeon]|mgnify:CR=1 FL=1|nr:hypothetical protein [Methanotrichaceae archaeon]HQI91020.1 hypothetical protein [Methanotrichaceae archaeon]
MEVFYGEGAEESGQEEEMACCFTACKGGVWVEILSSRPDYTA